MGVPHYLFVSQFLSRRARLPNGERDIPELNVMEISDFTYYSVFIGACRCVAAEAFRTTVSNGHAWWNGKD